MPLSLRENIYQKRHLPQDEDLLLARANYLSRVDRDLVEAVLVRGQSAASLARLMNVSPKVVRTRVNRLSRRMSGRKFMDTVTAIPYLSDEDARLARLHFCEGVSLRSLMGMLRLSRHELRRRIDRVAAQIVMLHRVQREQLGLRWAATSHAVEPLPS